MPKPAEILTIPLPPEGMSAARYRELEKALKAWEEQTRSNAKRFPRQSYQLGVEQTLAFLQMLGLVGQADLPPGGPVGPTKRAAVEWQQRYTLHELDGALDKYLDEIKSAALYGMRGAVNPTQVASWMYKATREAGVNWRMIARTEMVRANAAGRLDSITAMGYDQVWAPSHTGACAACRRLLENRVFTVEQVKDVTNYGRPMREWIACIPLHPHCRHVWLPYVQDVYEEAQREYEALEENGLDDETLNEMFDSSGQLKPKYENDPRLLAYFESTGKSDPLEFALAQAVEKVRRQEPPGLHHTSGKRNCHTCEWRPGDDGLCKRYHWPVDRTELCATWEPRDLGKGFFDNPQTGLDPLLWERDERLRADVRDRIVQWWRHTLTDDAPLWSRLYLTGSAASRAWNGKRTAGDVDLQVVIDYDALRKHHPEYAALSDPELHAALVTQIKASLDGVEAANGLPLDAFIRPQHSAAAFAASVEGRGQGVWDLNRGRWIVPPPQEPMAEDLTGGEILEGEGGDLALRHPDWLKTARSIAHAMVVSLDDLDEGNPDQLDALQAAYDYVWGLRKAEFANGEGADGIGNFIWRYLSDYGPLHRVKHLLYPTGLEKVWPGYVAYSDEVAKAAPAAPGTEHWITVHPHGENEKGIPVLIRENGDGSATVIGGAGGHLDFLRITDKGRIKGTEDKQRTTVAQAESPEEAQQREEAAQKAYEMKDRAKQEWDESKSRIEDLVRGVVDQHGIQLGEETVGWDELSNAQRKQLVQNALNDSLYQSTYGQAMDTNRAEAPSGPIVIEPSAKAPKEPQEQSDQTAENPDAAPNESLDEASQSTPRKQRIRIPMGADIADQIQQEHAGMSVIRKRVREANRVINQEGKPVDATTLEWAPIDKPNEAQRRAALKLQQQVNRELLGQVDEGRKQENSLVSQALRKGAFDAYDSFTHQLLGGQTMLTTGVTDLLGVSGTAQLVAHTLQEHARAGELDLKKVQDAIDSITDDRQKQITDVNLNRAKFAAREVAEMSEVYSAGLHGESTGLRTITSAKARQTRKSREAAMSLGMAVSGSEALHTLRALLQQPIDKVEVGGFTTPSQIKERAAKAKIKINPSDIVKHGPGNYSLKLGADRLSHLLELKPDSDAQLRSELQNIRTGQDMDNAIEAARHPAGYARTLDPAQAKGSLYLRHAGSGILAFAPGVGKTDTAIAAALEKMNAEPGKHKVLIVAPPTALAGAWAKTIQQAAPGKSLQIIGHADPENGDWSKVGNRLSPKARAKQLAENQADFNIIGFDTLAKNPELVKSLGHTIMVTDEMQYAKNSKSQRLAALDKAADGVQHRWALTGTPLEKKLDEYHTMLDWARPGEQGSVSSFKDRWKGLNQYASLSAEEKVAQFREATSTGAFFQSQDATHMPPAPTLQREHTPLTEGHEAAIAQPVEQFNEDWRARHGGDEGVQLPAFGGLQAQEAALMKPDARGYLGPNNRVLKVADLVQGTPDTDFKGFQGHGAHADGDHAGSYAGKSIVFGRQTKPLQPIKEELERRGTHKVFYTEGGDAKKNDQVLAAYLAHKGPAVLITSDTNKTARSLQFGDNGGKFQHGATRTIHTDLPINNADLSQRAARMWRRGAQANVSQHIIDSGTPVEQEAFDRLQSEIATQNALGNPEDLVGGRETVGQKLKGRGQRLGLGRKKKEATSG